MLKKLWVLPVDIRLSAHTNKLRFRPRSYSYIGNVPVLDVFDKPIADWDVVMKWLFDKIVGSLALLCALPIMAIVALAIKLDSRGPVLFRQKRYGFNNELIEIFKFRSMYADQADPNASKLVTSRRSARHPRRPLHPQDQPRRAAAALQRRVRRQPVAGRPAAARRAGQGRRPAVRRGGRRLFRPPSGQARASPAGRRSTAGAAKPTARKRSSSASSTTSTTSRTGRSCSISTSCCKRRSR